MSRRPLGASLPPEVRLVALEATVRDFYDGVNQLVDAVHAVSTGSDWDGHRIRPDAAASMLHQAMVRLQEIQERGIRAPRNGRATSAARGRRR